MRALTPLLLLTAPPATRSLTLLAPAARPHVLRAPPVAARVPKAFRGGLDLSEGSEWEGQVEEITDFGCFVRLGRLGVQRHRGLLHVSGLSEERLESAAVPDYVEETVGPVGSKVRVLVRSLEYKGRPRVSLQLLEVLSRQSASELSERAIMRSVAEGEEGS
uniref:S1 motif domain-containing protein n=1 Tax=Emiliania huxleyi TaxID=2903 RepID=A0A6V2T5A0_EMIHU